MSRHRQQPGGREHGFAIYTIVCAAWFALLVLLALWQGYPKAALTVAVPAGAHPFGDMRVAADGIEAAGRGQDVIGANYKPRDYSPIRFPYHRSWLGFSYVGVSGSATNVLAVALGLGMLAHLGALVVVTGNRALTGLVLAVFACSPPVMLALERGNPDLFLYLLLAGACHLLARRTLPAHAVGASLVFVAGALKFFPFAAALGVIPGEGLRRRGWLLVALMSAAILFLVLERNEVMRIATSPLAASDWASFGSAVSVNTLSAALTRVTHVNVPAGTSAVVRWCGVLVLAVGIWKGARALAPHAASLDGTRGVAATGFAAAAGMFVASFVLMRSYNYKFIFLALAIPALCEWSRLDTPPGRTARLALATLLLWLWSGLNGYVYLGMNIFVSWVCVGCVAALLVVRLLPAGVRNWLSCRAPGVPV